MRARQRQTAFCARRSWRTVSTPTFRAGDETLDALEGEAIAKLSSFPALSRDVFQSFYSLMPKRNDEANLSVMAQRFNRNILDHVTQSEDYPTLKNVCEGRELPTYEAASEFVTRTAGELDSLLSDIGGDKGALNTLDKLQQAKQSAEAELAGLLERLQQSGKRNDALEQSAVAAANKAESLGRQVEAVGKLIDAATARHKDDVATIIAGSVKAAAERAEETRDILAAWSDGSGNMERSEVNAALLETAKKSENLKSIARYLGRFREIFAQDKKNGYTYGRGEKFSLELGNSLSRALTSELAMLASPATVPLFLQKYQRRQIKQYRRHEPIRKGAGDIICCLDESASTEGDKAAWGKALAMALLLGFWAGILFLLLLDRAIPHLHLGSEQAEGPKRPWQKTTMLVLAVTLHNIPEGMAVGVVYAGFLSGNAGITALGALSLALGIAIQNFPEGAIISMPLTAEGASRRRAFWYGALSGAVEPLGALLTILFARLVVPSLPYLLSFAAGAMVYVVVEELIPEMSEGKHSNVGTVLFALGFTLMMALDTALG